jgi:TRAP-type C4-dicarboxylate transport system substrate-binding protein
LPFLFANAAHAFRVLDGPIGQELAQKLAGVGIVSYRPAEVVTD